MDVISAYRDVGTYRGAAAICGTTHKTVKRIIEAHEAASGGVMGAAPAPPVVRVRNYDEVADPKADLMVPLITGAQDASIDLAARNQAAAAWCGEVNAVRHSEICAVPAERLAVEQPLLGELPSLRAEFGAAAATRKVDKLSCIRFGSARYSVPNRLIGRTVTVVVADQRLQVIEAVTGEVLGEHVLVAPGETSIVDEHYGGPRPDTPRRAARAKTQAEKAFLALGPIAETFLTGAAAAGVSKLGTEIATISDLGAAHGAEALLAALERAVQFNRWRAADVRSILATHGQAPMPRPAGAALADAVVLTLPTVPTRSLEAYKIAIPEGGESS